MMPLKSSSRTFYGALAKAGITVALLAWLFYQAHLPLAAVQWQATEWRYLILFGPLVFLAYLYLDVLRWQIILEHQGLHLPFTYLVVIYTRGTVLGAILPGGTTTGDTYRMYSLAKNTQQVKTSISSVFLYRISGLCAVLILSIGTVQYSMFVMNKESLHVILKPIIFITALLLVIVVSLFALRQHCLEEVTSPHPLLSKIRVFLDGGQEYFSDKYLVLKTVGLAVVLQLVIVGWNYIVAKSLHVSVPFLTMLITVPLINLSALVPISLGGFGVREAGYVFFLVPFGLTSGEAISLSLISVLVQKGMLLISGIVFFYPITPIAQATPQPARRHSTYKT